MVGSRISGVGLSKRGDGVVVRVACSGSCVAVRVDAGGTLVELAVGGWKAPPAVGTTTALADGNGVAVADGCGVVVADGVSASAMGAGGSLVGIYVRATALAC